MLAIEWNKNGVIAVQKPMHGDALAFYGCSDFSVLHSVQKSRFFEQSHLVLKMWAQNAGCLQENLIVLKGHSSADCNGSLLF